MGAPPSVVWRSRDEREWFGPPSFWMAWDADGVRRRPTGEAEPAPDADPAHQARLWAEQTALSQGLPPRVADPTVIRNVAVLLGTGREPDIRFQRGGATKRTGSEGR